MTRRNEKRNNRRNRQRNNETEFSPFAQMIIGALLGKGADMIASVLMDKAAENDHPNDEPHTGIKKVGNHVEYSVIVKNNGTATEVPIPDNLQFFFDDDGKLMVRKKTEHETAPDVKEGNSITYDDICKELFFGKTAYWVHDNKIKEGVVRCSYNDIDNYTSLVLAKRTLAFNKLQNIAKYLNEGWKPNFNGNQKNWNIIKDDDTFVIMFTNTVNKSCVYFKTEELAREAIRIMGEDSLNDLFSTDW